MAAPFAPTTRRKRSGNNEMTGPSNYSGSVRPALLELVIAAPACSRALGFTGAGRASNTASHMYLERLPNMLAMPERLRWLGLHGTGKVFSFADRSNAAWSAQGIPVTTADKA